MTLIHVTLERPIGTTVPGLQELTGEEARDAETLRANNGRANDVVLADVSVPMRAGGGTVTCTLPLPADRPWPRLVVRAWVATDDAIAQGVVEIHP